MNVTPCVCPSSNETGCTVSDMVINCLTNVTLVVLICLHSTQDMSPYACNLDSVLLLEELSVVFIEVFSESETMRTTVDY